MLITFFVPLTNRLFRGHVLKFIPCQCRESSNKGTELMRNRDRSIMEAVVDNVGNPRTTILKHMNRQIDLSPDGMRQYLKDRAFSKVKMSQLPDVDLIQIMGPDKYAAHFILDRGGSVKLTGQSDWVHANNEGYYDLPESFGYEHKLEGISLQDRTLMYEGLESFRGLKFVKILRLNGSRFFDDWCLDKLCGIFYPSLEHLDLSGSCGFSSRGLASLTRLRNLKTLKIDKIDKDDNLDLTLILLEESLPQINILSYDYLAAAMKNC